MFINGVHIEKFWQMVLFVVEEGANEIHLL